MIHLAFLLLLPLNPEQQLARDLRSVKCVIVQHGGYTVTMHNSPILQKLRVVKVRNMDVEGEPPGRIQFGSFAMFGLWPRQKMMTTWDGLCIDFNEEFLSEIFAMFLQKENFP